MTLTNFPCSRCGKPRNIAKSWEESVEIAPGRTSTTKHTLMVCPDPECQALLEGELAKKEEKRVAMVAAKEERMQRNYHRPAKTAE